MIHSDTFPTLDDGMRVALGAVHIAAAVLFMSDLTRLVTTLQSTPVAFGFGAISVAHLIVVAHACGGTMLILGIQTRIAALIQIPILVGAVGLVDYGVANLLGLFSQPLAAATLLGTVVVMWRGGGAYTLGAMIEQRAGAGPIAGAARLR